MIKTENKTKKFLNEFQELRRQVEGVKTLAANNIVERVKCAVKFGIVNSDLWTKYFSLIQFISVNEN